MPVTDVAERHRLPEMLGDRVMTLHPKIHGGILADRVEPRAPGRHGGARASTPIDLVVANLYPFIGRPRRSS